MAKIEARNRPPRIDSLYGNRLRVTRIFDVLGSLASDGKIDANVWLPWNTADSTDNVGGQNPQNVFPECLLVAQFLLGGESEKPNTLTRVYETLTDTFVPELGDVTDFDMNGLERTTRTLIAKAGTPTADFVVGTQAYGSLYLAKVDVETTDGFVRVRAEYLEPGVVSRTIRQLDGGLREETVNSFYTKETPAGIITFEREENENGYPVWSVTAMQSSTGGDPITGAVLQSTTGIKGFEFPGRAKLYETVQTVLTVYEFTYVNVYMDPPLRVLVNATTDISYQASNAIGALTNPLWNPVASATLRSVFVTTLADLTSASNGARSKVQGLPGYRAANGAGGATESLTIDFESTVSSGVAHIAVPFGETVRLATPGLIGGSAILEGGPEKPDGNTYTLDYDVSPAFIGFDGTQYYRRTVVYATIPMQPALPV